jgi:HAD superfamily hydrolase (TIGR01458 family)
LEEFLGRTLAGRCQFLLPETLSRFFGAFEAGPDETPDYVVLGDCRVCGSYEVLNGAFRNLMRGAELVALQAGRYYVRADGLYLDTGAFVRLLEYASGKTARVLGKPSEDFFKLAFSAAGVSAHQVVVVGDDLSTDVAGAKRVGAGAILLRTGKFREDMLASAEFPPDDVLDSVAELSEELHLRSGPRAP